MTDLADSMKLDVNQGANQGADQGVSGCPSCGPMCNVELTLNRPQRRCSHDKWLIYNDVCKQGGQL